MGRKLHQRTSYWKATSLGLALLLLGSCASVQGYQKTFLNDEEMSIAGHKTDCFDHFQLYREGASGGIEVGETGGGCGCN